MGAPIGASTGLWLRPSRTSRRKDKTRGPTRHYRFRGMKGERSENLDIADHSLHSVSVETQKVVDQVDEGKPSHA